VTIYALKRIHVYREFEGQISVQEVLDREKYNLITLKTHQEEIRTLKEENKKLRGEEE